MRDAPDPAGWPTMSVPVAPVRELARRLARGDTSSSELVAEALRRVEEVDRAGPHVRAVLALDPTAPAAAARWDADHLARGADRRGRATLGGVPVMVKDTLDTRNLATTGGSLALQDVPPPRRNAVCVARLRSAGAILLGKANLSEWSNLRGEHSISGWSGAGGQTRNPYALRRSPGGSSSGTAAAVAAGLVPAAVGSETDGSILCPAALCGVVGLKPTVGLVPRGGAIPISWSQDSLGPIGRDVASVAELLTVLAGPDESDPASLAGPGRQHYERDLLAAGLANIRLGVPRRGFFGYAPKADSLVAAVLTQLRAEGATVVDPVEGADVPALTVSEDDEMLVLQHELRVGLGAYLATREAPAPRSVRELVEQNRSLADRELLHFGQEYLEAAAADPAAGAAGSYRDALERNRTLARAGLDRALHAYQLDALAVPTMGPAWLTDPVNGDPAVSAGYRVSAVAGYPALTLPIGLADGLPVGLALLGAAWSEARLLQVAAAIERVVGPLPAPRFLI